MKALVIVTVLAMATSAIAVPLSRQAKALALLAAMQDNAHQELDRESAVVQEEAAIGNAEMEGLLGSIGGFLKKLDPAMLRDGLRLLKGGDAGVQQVPGLRRMQNKQVLDLFKGLRRTQNKQVLDPYLGPVNNQDN